MDHDELFKILINTDLKGFKKLDKKKIPKEPVRLKPKGKTSKKSKSTGTSSSAKKRKVHHSNDVPAKLAKVTQPSKAKPSAASSSNRSIILEDDDDTSTQPIDDTVSKDTFSFDDGNMDFENFDNYNPVAQTKSSHLADSAMEYLTEDEYLAACSLQYPLTDESRPESVIPSQSIMHTQKLYRIGSNDRYADAYFITSDETKIPSHRNILAEVSTVCAKIFEEVSEIPVKINVDDFDAETIQSALDFCYDKHDAIRGKEIEVFKFAVKYGFQSLVDACLFFSEKTVDISNVFEIVKIAYANNFPELKKKCLKILFESRIEIDATKIADLPKNILIDAFRVKF